MPIFKNQNIRWENKFKPLERSNKYAMLSMLKQIPFYSIESDP